MAGGQGESLAELADGVPRLHDQMRRCLLALAGHAGEGHQGEPRFWQRRVRSALAPIRAHLCDEPADARRLVDWLFRHDHALLEDPATWARELPAAPRPGPAALAAVVDVALGLPPLPGDEALPRECDRRQGRYGARRVLGHPSPYPAIRALARRLELGPGEYLCDLGAGHGRVVLYLALLGLPARGVELLPDRCALAERARRARRLAGARVECGGVLDVGFWRGAGTIAGAGWYYCYDPFDDATDAELLRRPRAVAARRPVRLIAFVQTSRYRERYARSVAAGLLRRSWPPDPRPAFGLQVFQVMP